MKKRFICALLLASAAGLLYGNHLAKVYSESDPIYTWIEVLSMESGIAPMTSASPWSGYELYAHMEKIDYQVLSSQGKKIYDEVTAALLGAEAPKPFGAFLQLSPEVYVNLNKDDLTRRDWVYNNYHRKSPGYIEAEGVMGDSFYWIFTLEALNRINRMFPAQGEQNLGIGHVHANFQIPDLKLEDSIPHTAFAGMSSKNRTLAVGRDTLSWGRGNTGNLFIGNHAPYHDFISFSAYNDIVTYRFLAMQFDNIIDTDGNSGKSSRLSFNDKVRLFTAHRFEARVTPRLTLALTEGALFYTDGLDIRMFSPMVFIHNYMNFDEMKNFMQLDVDFLIRPSSLIYAQVFIDQLQLPGEVATYDDYALFPNAFGVLGGLQISRPVHQGYLTGFFETALTSTYLYLRRNVEKDQNEPDSPSQYWTDTWNLDLVQATNLRDRNGVSFLGYHYGPDSFLAAAHISYREFKRYSLFGDVVFGVQGEHGLEIKGKDQIADTGHEYLYQFLPSGQLEYFLITGIGGEYWVPQLPVMLYSQLNTIHRWNSLNDKGVHISDVQLMVGAELKLNVF